MDNILYFTHYETEVRYFLDDLSQQLDVCGIPYRINHQNRAVEIENFKIHAVSANSGLIGALPGFRYYLNDAMEEEFNRIVRLKLLEGAKELKSCKELIEFLRTPVF